MMGRFDFLLGDWRLEYKVPKSAFGEAACGTGTGTFRRALHERYVFFDYSCSLTTGEAQAHAVFARDEKAGLYRDWWFEDSGNFLTATCNFIGDDVLCLNWHDTLLVQTFTRVAPERVILKMEHPTAEGKYEPILEVIFTRR